MFTSLVPVLARGVHYLILFCLGFCVMYGVLGYSFQPDEDTKREWLQGILLYLALLIVYLALMWIAKRVRRRLFPEEY